MMSNTLSQTCLIMLAGHIFLSLLFELEKNVLATFALRGYEMTLN